MPIDVLYAYMKTTIMVVAMMLLSAGTAFGAVKLQKAVEFAQVGVGSESISVHKVVDGNVTCYITKGGKTVYHAISCVK